MMMGAAAHSEPWPGHRWQAKLIADSEEWRPLREALADLSQQAGGPEVVCEDAQAELTVPLAAGVTLRQAFSQAAASCGFDVDLVDGKLVAAKSNRPADWITPIGRRQPVAFDDLRGDLVLPHGASAPGNPWVWYAPSQGLLPCNAWIMNELLKRGIAVAMVGVGESWGNPQGREIYKRFYEHLTGEHALASQPVLWPQSRGGLMLYNWAVEHPQAVRAVAGIYTVCNLAAWAKNRQPATAQAYNLTVEEFQAQLPKNNPVDRLHPLVDAKVPIFHIHGDKDLVVPLEEHAEELVKRYKALGGSAELLLIPGKGHAAVKEYFQCRPLVDFMLRQALVTFPPPRAAPM
jgi:pimeloyl-ACP methyl ester carboxylesterase